MAVMSQNQSDYLNGLLKGGGGNAAWANSQLQGSSTMPQADPALVAAHQAAANQFKANNWGPNGTANGQTQAQNLSGVLNQPGNTAASNLSPYLSSMLSQNRTDTTGNVGVQGNGGVQGNNGMSQGQSSADLINSIYQSQLAAQQQQNKQNRDTQLAGLSGQDTLAQQNATNQLNQNDVSGARLANQLREQMANLGLLQGGDYISQQLAQNTAQGQNANVINQNLTNSLNGNLAQRNAINNNANASDLAIMQNLQGQQSQNLLNDLYKSRDQSNWQQTFDQTGQNNKFNQNLAKSAQDYNQSPFNPNNVSLSLTNQLNQLKLNDYPAQSQAAAQQVQQQLQAGQITNQEAQLKLDQLKDPNSLANQQLKAQLDLTNSQSSYYKDHGQYYASGGSQSGSSSANRTATANSYTGSIYDQLSQLDPSDYAGYLKANQGEIVNNIGQKAYDDLEKSVMADQNAQGKADTAQGKADATIRSQAITSAQKDPRWLDGKTDKKALIKEYESYHQ